MKQRIQGGILAYLQIFLNIGIALLFTPILVGSLGQAGYGLFSIVGSIAAYLALVDFGLNDVVVRFLVGQDQARDTEGANRFLSSMFTLYASLGLLCIIGGVLLTHLSEVLFSGSLSGQELALIQEMILVVTLGTIVTVSSSPVGALIIARERFVFLRLLEIVVHVFSTLLIVVLLSYGYGPLMVVSVMTAGAAATVIAKNFYAISRLGLRIRYTLPAGSQLRTVAFYAAPIFIVMLVEQIYWKLDNIIIGALAGASIVAVYAIGVIFHKYFMSFGTAISRIMLPEIIRRVDAGADPVELTQLMVRVSRYQGLVLMLILTGLILFGDSFILLWLGPGYEMSYWVMLLVLVPYSLELIGNTRNIILQAKGLYWYRAALVGSIALLNIPLTIYLFNIYGVIGAALSTGLCVLLGYILLAFLLKYKVGLNILAYLRGVWLSLLPALILSLGAGAWLDSQLSGGWLVLGVEIALYTAFYAIVVWVLAMNKEERAIVQQTFTSFLGGLPREG